MLRVVFQRLLNRIFKFQNYPELYILHNKESRLPARDALRHKILRQSFAKKRNQFLKLKYNKRIHSASFMLSLLQKITKTNKYFYV